MRRIEYVIETMDRNISNKFDVLLEGIREILMNQKKGRIMNVNNCDTNHERYVVARVVDGELWYWGSWDNRESAENVAKTFDNGIVVDMKGE